MGLENTMMKKSKKPSRAPQGLSEPLSEKPVALTLKIDTPTYIRLSALRAKERKTAQNILEEALNLYLKSAGY